MQQGQEECDVPVPVVLFRSLHSPEGGGKNCGRDMGHIIYFWRLLAAAHRKWRLYECAFRGVIWLAVEARFHPISNRAKTNKHN